MLGDRKGNYTKGIAGRGTHTRTHTGGTSRVGRQVLSRNECLRRGTQRVRQWQEAGAAGRLSNPGFAQARTHVFGIAVHAQFVHEGYTAD